MTPTPSSLALILSLIPRDGAITRAALSEATGLDDRHCRLAVRALRLQGHPIVLGAGGKGYRLDASPETVRRMAAKLLHYATESRAVANAMLGALRPESTQTQAGLFG